MASNSREAVCKSSLCFPCSRDFANGFLVAELLARYYPADVQMHSFSNVHSAERKKNNWFLLNKFFKVRPRSSIHKAGGGRSCSHLCIC